MKKNLIAALAVVAASSTAVAFEGFYGGIAGGYDWANVKDTAGDNSSIDEVKPKGFVASLFGGYNFPLSDQIFLGPEARAGYSWAKKTLDGTNVDVKHTWNGSLAVRIGFAVSEEVLLFVKGGGDYRKFEVSSGSTSISESKLGWLAGAGVEYKFDENIAVRGDYTFTRHKTDFGTGVGAIGGDVTFKNHQAAVGVAWYF